MLPKESTFIFADLFAGIGGMRIAFESVGGHCVLTSEIDRNALTTYFANFPQSPGHRLVRDVLKLDPKDFDQSNRELDVLVAGFPCQPYSIAGLRKGLQDDRGGQIFNALVRLMADVKPRAFLLENVRGIMSHDSGETFRYMLDRLEENGYTLRFASLNSMRHANVPQNRERVFIVGFLDSTHASRFDFPDPIELSVNFRDLLEHPDDIPIDFYYDERYPAFDDIRQSITSESSVYQWRRHYVRENKAGVCPTLTANMGSGGHNVPLVLDRRGIRKLTPREAANLQGFPANFILPAMAKGHLYHQLGNSVTVPLIQRLALGIRDALAT